MTQPLLECFVATGDTILLFAVRIDTHVVFPSDLVGPRRCLDGALEVDVVALLDVAGVEVRAKGQRRAGDVWKRGIESACRNHILWLV